MWFGLVGLGWALFGLAWCGVVWCGLVWYDVVWCMGGGCSERGGLT